MITGMIMVMRWEMGREQTWHRSEIHTEFWSEKWGKELFWTPKH